MSQLIGVFGEDPANRYDCFGPTRYRLDQGLRAYFTLLFLGHRLGFAVQERFISYFAEKFVKNRRTISRD